LISIKLVAIAWLCLSLAMAGVDHDERRATLRYTLTQQGIACDSASLVRAVQEDQRPIVRSLAAELLTSLAEPGTAALLRARLQKDSDDMVLAHLASDLLDLERDAAIPLAHSTLEKLKNPEDRLLVLGPLAELGDFSGYSEVVAAVHSSYEPIQRRAVADLVAFVNKCRQCDLIPPPIELALSLLNANTFSVRLSAAIAAQARLGDDPRVEVALRKMAATEKNDSIRIYVTTILHLWERKSQHAGGSR
jgi:hypothetical protein